MTDAIATRPTVTLAAARTAADAALAEAQRLGIAVAVAVVDPGGHDVAFAAMDGSPLLSRDVARDKAWTAIAFGQPTTWWADLLEAEPGLAALGGNNRLMPVPGGIPLLVDGAIAGAVGVSGGTPDEDVQVAAAGVLAVGGD